jgi:hypothetical protein
MVLFTTGPKRFDPTCTGTASLPHMLIGSNADKSERLMASGNERTTTRFNSPYTPNEKLGYPLNPADKFDFIVDFMNENKQDKIVYLTMTYDFIEGRPEGFSNFRSIWLDIVECGTSEKAAPKGKDKFVEKKTWVANLDGDILGMGGHLHDGGVNLEVRVDNEIECDSVATYGVTPGGKSGGMMGGDGMGAMGRMISTVSRFASGNSNASLEKRDGPGHGITGMPHITKMSVCGGPTLPVRKLKKGQNWSIHAYYDYAKHNGMKTAAGAESNIMGIAIMMVKNWSA